MLQQRRGSSSALDRPFVTPPRKRSGVAARELFFAVMLSLLLLSDVLGGWGFTLPRAYAAGRPPSPPANMTFQQFLKQGRHDRVYHGPFVHPQSAPAVPGSSHEHSTDYRHLPPSAELVTMKPISQPLDASLLAGSAGGKPLDLVGSDKRLEVQIQPGSLDVSHATVPGGGAPSGTLTLQFSEIHGHFAGGVNLLGAYSLTFVDGKGQTISGMRLLKPVTFVYHYQPWELVALDLDPGKLFMTWPDLIAAARKANQPTSAFTMALVNDPKAHTLTGQSTVFGPGPLDVGGGDPQNQSPPIPHLASVQGNAGQLSYAYPLQLPPGPAGFAPQLVLSYSSSGPNERHSGTSPGNDTGDGWVLSLGSVSAEVYPAGSASAGTWYFLSGVANVSDRLIPNPFWLYQRLVAISHRLQWHTLLSLGPEQDHCPQRRARDELQTHYRLLSARCSNYQWLYQRARCRHQADPLWLRDLDFEHRNPRGHHRLLLQSTLCAKRPEPMGQRLWHQLPVYESPALDDLAL